ncbi:hypothetical protein [Halomicrococcus sp. NG-SE-24]|uniref:hypothetical protein n=1 Tax=Halomicrococcus sp. NG-SE-24 TaxID=3436928 RepID=UPI003D95DA4C
MLNRVSRRELLTATAGLAGVGGIDVTSAQATNHFVIFGGSPDTVVDYALTVSGRLQKSGRSGGAPIADRHVTQDGEDTISSDGTHASGAIAGGGDAYQFTGRVVRFRISPGSQASTVRVYLNGQQVRPDQLGDNPAADTPITFLDCDRARVTGSFQSVRMHTSFWDDAGLGTNFLFDGPISGTTTIHPVAAHDPYPFAIDTLSVDTRELQTPGQPAKFTADNPYAGPWCAEQLPNHIVVFGGSPQNVIRYQFTASGHVRKSGSSGGAPIADQHVTIDNEDSISGGRVRGAIAGGGDAYQFSGELTQMQVDGDATVYLNGQQIDPTSAGGETDGSGDGDGSDDRGDDDDGETPTTGIEFLACDRARVTGAFERVTIDTTWYATDGVARSHNEIGPVSGRTRIDESNVGDVAGVAGFVITNIAAFEQGAGEPTVSKRNPNTDQCLGQIRPAKISASVADCTATSDGVVVTFVYENPNDVALRVQSDLVGASSTAPPDSLKPGQHAFDASWAPENPDDRLRWRLDLRPFGYENPVTATSPTAADCGLARETTDQADGDGERTAEDGATEEPPADDTAAPDTTSDDTPTTDVTTEQAQQSDPTTDTPPQTTEKPDPETEAPEPATDAPPETPESTPDPATEAPPETPEPTPEPMTEASDSDASGTTADSESERANHR